MPYIIVDIHTTSEEGNERMALKFWREMFLAGKILCISCVSVHHLSAHPVKASYIQPRNNYLLQLIQINNCA